MLPYKRSQRVSDLIREEIADIIMNKVKDPRLGLSQSRAKITEDLENSDNLSKYPEGRGKETTIEMLIQQKVLSAQSWQKGST